MRHTLKVLAAAACAALLIPMVAVAEDFEGTARLGYIYIDEEGNRGVYQPTFNLYEGPAVSLEDFYYTFDNGLRVFGDLRNATLNNRNLALGVSKPGHGGVNIRHDQYRRIYNFDGDRFTRRNNTSGQAWFQPIRLLKIFGGAGVTNKHGDLVELFTEPPLGNPLRGIDYTHTYYNAGATVGAKGRFATFEYRRSDFSDDIGGAADDRSSQRFRLSGYSMVPNYENLVLHAGFQRAEYRLDNVEDSLIANTGWAGARYFFGDGWSVRYNFIWDRTRRSTDLVATDNLTHAVYGDKVFRGLGGLTVGYQYRTIDDVLDELRADGYVVSGWVRPLTGVTVRAGYGADLLEVRSGRTLTGDEDRTRAWASVRYRYDQGTFRVKVEDRSIENDNIGSTVDFVRASSDLSVLYERFGELSVAYAYYNGEYENGGGGSRFEEHVVSGDLLSAPYRNAQAGFGGTYMRSRLDADVESFTVRLLGRYNFMQRHAVEVIYSAYNFDNFADLAGIYSEYYTSNVVEVNLVHEF